MTDFDSVSTSTYQPGSFALHCSPAGRTDRWALLLHARKFGRSPSYDIRHSARRVLQALPGLLYLTAYPNPLKSIARMLSQRHVNSRQSARSGSAGVVSVELARRKARRDASSWRGRPPSLESFNDGYLVKVKHATTADLDVRAKNVKDNLAMIKQAAELEIERIETIQRAMREMNLPFAGQALVYLND